MLEPQTSRRGTAYRVRHGATGLRVAGVNIDDSLAHLGSGASLAL